MTILNKADQTQGKIQYHVRVKPGDVAKYVLLPGDPARADRVAKYLDDPVLIANNREYRTFTGTYKGVGVSVTSTGIGCPSASIAVEELANVGAEVFIRIGSSAALQPEIRIGDLLVSSGSMKNEGTSRYYVPDCFPAVPDLDLTHTIIQTARSMKSELDFGLHVGICASDDAFYGETQEWIEKLAKLGVMNVEMESSAIYTVAHVRKLKAACICAVSGNLITGEVVYEKENTRLVEGWDKEIKVVLESIYRFETNQDK
ncbi:nucleoside phosphorylase [Desulfosporosinus lacus]|uniref:Uridine phosphorylase n=1 Tax=Desulfosporosinus lacus DSM 15449 TaxID=1121420 RepID=A0A1M5RNY0_9FIRM|nr:nucleoside phosphorylase [Desulfosporosinus lacus]MDA8226717.1 nucleoside phosphorylase [Desulfitobacterium hafniense]SHH27830.1 uridine phosphorylase [Desulfosporosinus lacus DSM 15449]